MSILVLADHTHNQLNPATAKVVAAAAAIDADIHVLVAGFECQTAAQQAAQINKVSNVLVADGESLAHQLAENVATLVASLGSDYTHILSASTTTGKNVMPRIAALLNVAQISDITEVIDTETFVRPFYAGNAMAKVRSHDKIKVITVRTSAFDSEGSENNCEITAISAPADSGKTRFIREALTKSERPDLASAPIVVSGGRGMQSGENFTLLEAVADKLGGAIGASRAAVDAGFVPNDLQVGQTGKIVAPQLYIAVGISGAIQHLAGMKDSKIIVAINKDEEAPIFQVADYGLVADLFEAIPELTSKL